MTVEMPVINNENALILGTITEEDSGPGMELEWGVQI